ncbi:MAG: transposase, partial [Proteobacteria bacterium]|nr:transposase [Pseudomonadota bacterium]
MLFKLRQKFSIFCTQFFCPRVLFDKGLRHPFSFIHKLNFSVFTHHNIIKWVCTLLNRPQDVECGHGRAKASFSGIDYPGTFQEFDEWFGSENACVEYIVKLRWQKGFICPRCGE